MTRRDDPETAMRRPVSSMARPAGSRLARAAAVVALTGAGAGLTACNCGKEPAPADYATEVEYFIARDNFSECERANGDLFRSFIGMAFHLGAKPAAPFQPAAAAKAPGIVTEGNSVTFYAPADVPAPNAADLPVPYELIAPFRIECVVGLCDPAFYPAPTAVFGFSVVERGGAQREFSADCSRVGGMTATAGFGTPAPQAFAGAQRVDLALEHDGTDLVASARDHNLGGAWIEVARTPLAASGPFLPKLGALNFDPGQMVTYSSFRVRANAPYGPGQATPQMEAVRNFAEALNDLADGADALVGAAPDAAAASLKIQAANQRVQEAVTAIEAAAALGKKPTAAMRKLKKARAAARKAAAGVAKAIGTLDATGIAQKPAVLKKVGIAALGLAQAADQILPGDLRAAIGGRTLKSFLGK